LRPADRYRGRLSFREKKSEVGGVRVLLRIWSRFEEHGFVVLNPITLTKTRHQSHEMASARQKQNHVRCKNFRDF
jgi:hypothetical protein